MRETEFISVLPILDPERVAALRLLEQRSSPGLLRDLVDTFREESAEALERLERCSIAEDSEGIRKSAHLLASMSAGLAAARICGMAQEIERWAGLNGRSGTAPGLTRLRREREEALGALEAELAVRR